MHRPPPRSTFALPAAVALVLVLAAACSGCGGGDSTTVVQTTTVTDSSTTNEGPTTTATTDSTSTDTTGGDDGSGPVLHASQFQSPTGNIGCVMFHGGARCDARMHEWKAGPAPSDCPLDYGDGIEVGRTGAAKFVCAGDTTLGAGPKLQYGSSSSVKGATCESAEDGVTCHSATGPGFFISIQSYKFLGSAP